MYMSLEEFSIPHWDYWGQPFNTSPLFPRLPQREAVGDSSDPLVGQNHTHRNRNCFRLSYITSGCHSPEPNMFCSFCSSPIGNVDTFCKACGRRLPALPDSTPPRPELPPRTEAETLHSTALSVSPDSSMNARGE